jgi:hypothetical protein
MFFFGQFASSSLRQAKQVCIQDLFHGVLDNFTGFHNALELLDDQRTNPHYTPKNSNEFFTHTWIGDMYKIPSAEMEEDSYSLS